MLQLDWNSNIFQKAEQSEILAAPTYAIHDIAVRPLILGDGGYPLLTWLMKPYNVGLNLSQEQRNFNRALSSSRSSVERAFGILKARWRCLIKRLDSNVENIPDIIISCCVLHNICQNNNDLYEDEDELLDQIIRQERQQRQRRRNLNERIRPNAEAVRVAIREHLMEEQWKCVNKRKKA